MPIECDLKDCPTCNPRKCEVYPRESRYPPEIMSAATFECVYQGEKYTLFVRDILAVDTLRAWEAAAVCLAMGWSLNRVVVTIEAWKAIDALRGIDVTPWPWTHLRPIVTRFPRGT